MSVRYRIKIQGVVQGVGFRPFIYKLASEYGLTGWIKNHSKGVSIEIQGARKALEDFILHLEHNPPVLAQITELTQEMVKTKPETEFLIKKSEQHSKQLTLISPDICTCEECFAELLDTTNRRYQYPFINCTNCGPRFTIIKDIPYDRSRTTMSKFDLCEKCSSEYNNPKDRRFHAQPNACAKCGPGLQLISNSGEAITGDPIKNTIKFLKEGGIIAIKGLGGFHLAVDALPEQAIERLRMRKRRYEKPLALMSKSVEQILRYAQVSVKEKNILESLGRPICLLKKKRFSIIAQSVSPDNDYFGVMLPYTPLHYLLLHQGGFLALVMTSGNISEEPIVFKNEHAFQHLKNVADYFLLHNRDIHQPADDSVVRVFFDDISYIRRSRGVVPLPILTKRYYPSVLAVGGELKNTICLNKNNYFFLSQHIGDLENIETLEFFENAIKHLKKILEIDPQLIACDLHPDYLSTEWVNQQQHLPQVSIQHHHAHIAACMAEKELSGEVIGISLDGTGFGSDGTIWGGEILLSDEYNFKRIAHLKQVPLPGGEKAIKEPWRMLLAYSSVAEVEFPVKTLFSDVGEHEINIIKQMINQKVNCPITSSCGRLFDAVAMVCGCRHKVGYEGQAAMQLEALLSGSDDKSNQEFYHLSINSGIDVDEIDWKPLIISLKEDLDNNTTGSIISWKFHRGLVEVLLRAVLKYRKEFGINRIVLSGGCFQNRFLSEVLTKQLIDNQFNVFYHTLVSPNDSGLALGQAYIAANRMKAGMI